MASGNPWKKQQLSAREDYLKVIVEVFRAIQTERPTPLSGR
jgi:hypothetical protein